VLFRSIRLRAESFSLSAVTRYLERSRAGTRRTNCSARSSGSVKVIFRVAILPYYYYTGPRFSVAGPEQLRIETEEKAGPSSALRSEERYRACCWSERAALADDAGPKER